MIDILTRVQNTELYSRLQQSVCATASGENIGYQWELDRVGKPDIARTYNRLIEKSSADILVFAHDDIVFMSPGWDAALTEIFAEDEADLVGVVGAKEYHGGAWDRVGNPHMVGKWATMVGDALCVKVLSKGSRLEPVAVVDGMFMAMRRDKARSVGFDERLNGLFYYDLDMSLRAGRVAVADILLGHYKPTELRGVYPADMEPIAAFDRYFNTKHGFAGLRPQGDNRCVCVTPQDYERMGQDAVFSMGQEILA